MPDNNIYDDTVIDIFEFDNYTDIDWYIPGKSKSGIFFIWVNFFDLLERETLVRVLIVAEVWIAFALGYLARYLEEKKSKKWTSQFIAWTSKEE